MWHKPCRTFHPWCPCIKTRCLFETLSRAWRHCNEGWVRVPFMHGHGTRRVHKQKSMWLRSIQNRRRFADDYNSFSWMKITVFRFIFAWHPFVTAQLTTSQQWFRLWFLADWARSHYVNHWPHGSLTYVWVTRHQWVEIVIKIMIDIIITLE